MRCVSGNHFRNRLFLSFMQWTETDEGSMNCIAETLMNRRPYGNFSSRMLLVTIGAIRASTRLAQNISGSGLTSELEDFAVRLLYQGTTVVP